jgi:hypothetical protein
MNRDLKHVRNMCVNLQQVSAIHSSAQHTYQLLGRPLSATDAQDLARRAHADVEWVLTQLVRGEYQ